MVDSSQQADRQQLLGKILSMDKDIYWHVRSGSFDHWLDIDLPMPQLKALIVVYGNESTSMRMGQLASALGVAFSTATGVVDRLVEQGLLVRQVDPDDRRLVVVGLTERGHETVERPYRESQRRFAAVLEHLDLEELEVVRRGLGLIHEVAKGIWPLRHEVSDEMPVGKVGSLASPMSDN